MVRAMKERTHHTMLLHTVWIICTAGVRTYCCSSRSHPPSGADACQPLVRTLFKMLSCRNL
jgi:hypothetical protein